MDYIQVGLGLRNGMYLETEWDWVGVKCFNFKVFMFYLGKN